MLSSNWVINPTIDMPEVLEQYGRFLAPDYRVLFESLEIPSIFEEDLTPSGRRFVIIGGDDNPALLAKNVFLCAKLSGAESVDIRSHYMDELFLAQNVLENHADGIRHKVHMPLFEGIHLNQGWYDAIEQATDIIVYGSDHTISMYREYENVDRAVWEYPERFSLGVIRSDSIDYGMAAEMCFDFVCYYGHGRLAPKFYFVVGPITKKVINTISECIYALFRDAIEEYRNKLPLTRKSDFTQKYMNAHYASYYLRIGKLTDKDLFDSLYGDIKLVQVNDIDEVEQFIVKYRDKISTVAVDYDDEETFETICDLAVPRLCGVGEMQFPDFFEQYDIVDDFEIYVKNEEE